MWTYRARLTRVVDGDTYDVEVDLGFRVRTHVRVRLADVDTAEVFGVSAGSDEHKRGTEQATFVRGWFREAREQGVDWPIRIRTTKTGKYGRWLADITRVCDDANLAADLQEVFDL